MPKFMASLSLLDSFLLPLLTTLFVRGFASEVSINSSLVPFNCSAILKCDALLYHINNDLKIEDIASFYSVNSSQINPINGTRGQDYLIEVPCSCRNTSELQGYFYDTTYTVKLNDKFENISTRIYSGQAMPVAHVLKPNKNLTINLLCGCSEKESEIVVTYTVQPNDTPEVIADRLHAKLPDMQKMNPNLDPNPSFIQVDWVLFVPQEIDRLSPPNKSKGHKRKIVIGILAVLALLLIFPMILVVYRRNRANDSSKEDPKAVSKGSFTKRRRKREDRAPFESEKPVVFSLEEIEEATNNFDETRKIGVGGFGSVYFGLLEEKEVAIKKMKSNKSEEFYAELKILCKIHHINIVELLGYASGEEYLYLVYEYVPNGSLSDHLHDPLLKGHQPLSWTQRAQIALDAAKGLEYIHDYTKVRYVHCDMKTSNILLDEKFRAKVADFGLAKLVERTNDQDFVATRLVGTPGYLPPEAVKQFQVTPKTDVFAFGVVLAELVTGKRALFRDSKEANNMKSLIALVYKVFQDDEPETALKEVIDVNLRGSYPMDHVYKMADISEWCLREDPADRPEMRDIVGALSQVVMHSVEWEASLRGKSAAWGSSVENPMEDGDYSLRWPD